MNKDYTVHVKDFTTIPGPRMKLSGDNSAEQFFEDFIEPILDRKDFGTLTIDFSGTWGYGPSFTSQLGIFIVERLGDAALSRVEGIAEDDPEVVDRFKTQMKEYVDEQAE